MCKYNHELCKYDLRGFDKQKVNEHYFEFIRNATRKEYDENGWSSNMRGLYKCRICGEEQFILKHNFKIKLQVCEHGCNGEYRQGGTVVVGYNNIAITKPNLVKYFFNVEDTYTNSYGSRKVVTVNCPRCGKCKEMVVDNLYAQGFSCDFCGDGVSYPEKVMATVLNELGISFKKQYKFNDFKYKYDFLLIDYNVIIEVHGNQHYKGMNNMVTYEDEHENDVIKYDLAVLNGYEYNKSYFIIDCRYSNIDYIKDNIERCKLFKQFKIDIDWGNVDKQSQNSLKMEVCRYWEEQKRVNKDLTTTDIANYFKLGTSTINYYLNWGNNSGICNYNGKEEQNLRAKNIGKQLSIYVYLVDINGNKWIDEPLSLIELSRRTGISKTTLTKKLHDGTHLQYNNRAKYDVKYIGSRVVLVDK